MRLTTGTTRIILNGDDFGQSPEDNRGIEQAYRAQVLTSASLMVGGCALDDAVAIARRNPGLAVGLHIALSDATPVLCPSDIPLLIGSGGRFPRNEAKLHKAALRREGLRQLRAEIAAQFQAFDAIGLPCDHVDSHRNSYVHPVVAWLVFQEAARHGVQTVRIPWDDLRPPRRGNSLRYARTLTLRAIAKYYGLKYSDRVITRHWTTQELIAVLARLPCGSTEIYFHPADRADHPFGTDLPALLHDNVRQEFNRICPQISLAIDDSRNESRAMA